MATKQTQEEKQGKLIDQLIQHCTNNPDLGINDRLFKVSQDLLGEIDSYTGTKETEKHLIDMLVRAEGYFKDEFTPDEINRMKFNIAIDFPIFMETHVGTLQDEVNQLTRANVNLFQEIKAKDNTIEAVSGDKDRIEAKLTNLLHELLRNDGVIDLNNHYSKEAIIIAKLHEGQTLTHDEVTLIESNISNHGK